MAFRRFEKLTGNSEAPNATWSYIFDAEADLASAPDDCVMAIVLAPADGSKQMRIKNTSGAFVGLD